MSHGLRRPVAGEVLPNGGEFISEAAERTGFDREGLLTILRWHGVSVHRTESFRARPWAMRAEIDAAVSAWLETETPRAAARRLGMHHDILRRWLVEAGHTPPPRGKPWRLPSSTIEAVVAERRGRRAA